MLNQISKFYPSYGIFPAIKIWTLIGMSLTSKSSITYKIYGIALHVVFTICFKLLIFYDFFSEFDLFADSIDVTFQALNVFSYLSKFILFLYYRKRLYEFIEKMDEILTIDSTDKKELKLISNGLIKSRKIFYLTKFFYTFGGIIAFAKIYFAEEKILPFSRNFPFGWKIADEHFWKLYLYQFIGTNVHIIALVGFDTLPASILAIISGYLDALGNNLEKIGNLNQRELIGFDHIQSDDELFGILVRKYFNILK